MNTECARRRSADLFSQSVLNSDTNSAVVFLVLSILDSKGDQDRATERKNPKAILAIFFFVTKSI